VDTVPLLCLDAARTFETVQNNSCIFGLDIVWLKKMRVAQTLDVVVKPYIGIMIKSCCLNNHFFRLPVNVDIY